VAGGNTKFNLSQTTLRIVPVGNMHLYNTWGRVDVVSLRLDFRRFHKIFKSDLTSSCLSICPSLRPHGATRLPVEGLS